MTKQELYEHLHKHFVDEVAGVEKYLALAETAEELGDYIMAQKLLNIAKDEYTHGKAIIEHIQLDGIRATSEEKEKWEKAEQHLFKYVK